MLGWIALIFALAAVGGLVQASYIFKGKHPNWALSIGHALAGALGLVLLIAAVVGGAGSTATIALVVLIITALGGFFLASFHLREKLPPKAVVVVHGLIAITGFLILLRAAQIW